MDKRKLRNKIYAHEYAHNHGNMEWCESILTQLEAENYHTLVVLLQECEWTAAYKWIEENMQQMKARFDKGGTLYERI